MQRRLLLVAAVSACLAACDNAGTDFGFPAENPNHGVSVLVYLDRDGSRSRTSLDTVYTGARISLTQRLGGAPLQTEVTGVTGIAHFTQVPEGDYRVTVSSTGLGDSVQVAAIDSANIRVTLTSAELGVLVRLTYPEVTVRQARGLPNGKRVFVRGVILSGVQQFRDTTSHLADSSGAIRLTRVLVRGGSGSNPGDSVAVLGTTATRSGQRTLDQSVVAPFGVQAPPVPLLTTTATAATANGGDLDAALVQVISAVIADSATVAPDFKVTINDGSGALTLLLDANLSFRLSDFAPGKRVTARGVLVPNGGGTWVLKPRAVGDAIVF